MCKNPGLYSLFTQQQKRSLHRVSNVHIVGNVFLFKAFVRVVRAGFVGGGKQDNEFSKETKLRSIKVNPSTCGEAIYEDRFSFVHKRRSGTPASCMAFPKYSTFAYLPFPSSSFGFLREGSFARDRFSDPVLTSGTSPSPVSSR